MLVKNIKLKNDMVEVVLENEIFFISKENYIENPIAIASDIDKAKIDYLLNQEKVIEGKAKLIKLINKKVLTEYESFMYLKQEGINKDDSKKIILSLKNIGLINDEYNASLIVDSLLFKRKGKLEIKKILIEKKIDENIIDKVIGEIEDDVYLDNFNKIFNKYLKMYSNKSYKLKENMIISKLKEYGYENELISSIVIEKDNKEEIEMARKNLLKILKNKRFDLNDFENINKIKIKLSMKGFSYDIINLVLEEVIKNETY